MAKKVFLITVFTFAVFFLIDEFYFKAIRQWLEEILHQRGSSHILAYTLVGIPIFIAILWLHKRKGFFGSLGLNKSPVTGMFFALLCTFPMFVGYAIFFNPNPKLTLDLILVNAVAAGIFEELYFRGFLFGQFYRYTRLGFFSSVFLSALLPGIAHVFLGSDVMEVILVFLIAFFSGLIFSWLFAEWNFNLWVPIFLHMFINLSWVLSAIDEHLQGDLFANWFRFFTVVLAVILTVVYKKRKGLPMEVLRSGLLMKNKNVSSLGV